MSSDFITYKVYDYQNNRIGQIKVSKDGCSPEVLAFLDEDDHRQELQERYIEENESYEFQRAQFKAYQDPDNHEDPVSLIPSHYEEAEQTYKDSEQYRQCLEELRSHILELTPSQQELYARVNYDKTPQSDIAKEDDVTPTAVFNRIKKMNRRLEKLCRKNE